MDSRGVTNARQSAVGVSLTKSGQTFPSWTGGSLGSSQKSLFTVEKYSWPVDSEILECIIYGANTNYQYAEVGRFHFRNPAYKKPE
jgi:hypothetical protein